MVALQDVRGGTSAKGQTLSKIRVAPDGRSFETSSGKPFVVFGVTYYRPGTGWAPQVWRRFDPEATRRDFERMKEMGVNCVRVFLSYKSFYWKPGQLSPEGVKKFDQFLAIAEAAGIYVQPTGPDHWEGTPGWAAGDPMAREAYLKNLEAFWRLFAARYRGRHVIFAYELRNEPEVSWSSPAMHARWMAWVRRDYPNLATLKRSWGLGSVGWDFDHVPIPRPGPHASRQELLDYQHFRESIADEWTRRQVRAIKSTDPNALVTVGLIQWSVPALLPGIEHYSGFRPERQAKFLDFMEIHFYPLAGGFFAYRSSEAEERNLAYLESVVREVARPGKPVVVGEFGWYGGGRLTIDRGRHPAATQEQQAQWCGAVVKTTEGLATGWLNWGLYDEPGASDVSQLTGLLTVEGRTKAWGKTFSKLARRVEGKPFRRRKLGPRPALNWDECLVDRRAEDRFRRDYEKAFLSDEAQKVRK